MSFITKVFAQDDSWQRNPDALRGGSSGNDIVGAVTNPLPNYGNVDTGLILFFSNILRLVFVAGGIFAFINIVVAGFQYMTAAGDTKLLTAAWNRIWQSLVGLIIIVGSFAFASLFGYLIFGDAGFILNPKIYGPGK
ncbi:hypothetical protein KKB64_00170 [Patescibacteria group bacterium]|nr:hypothetical protein [Patescibacteria group bacterium]MBU1472190.1 hypothetical protein [Patescibacteria group bacterium]MBU2459584.1 hypothetical protein [Patescibacteria group bacterium]MBU2544175.1 hypothetical protein [Patescibacteria group bacterium]